MCICLTNRTKVQIIINKLSFGEISFAVRNIIRSFANNKQKEKRKMIQKKYSEEQERMARFAKAMGHPARMAILQFLARQESCFFGDIHEELPIAKATVSQHLKELKDAGLIQGEIEAPKVKYCINRENWEIARRMFADFFGQPLCKKEGCCR
ncbi:transcriptional regulator, ArsR family [Phocaeicola coprophilus DSM 18228 = JCM 13818]|uniref:Transcriptional regulator, ArsR family n=3 Tax=Phocaeicola coprophilus TaxID=387090 RepID=S0F648_9BACT|nr:transcriptional regulator, ArsR family [Phocaeicola coprophilus DSM 18228 = JCM 13818]